MADRRHDGRTNNRPNQSQRSWNNGHRDNVRVQSRSYRTQRNPVHYSNGHYRFHNGHSVRYTRPYIGVRYTNYRVRPVVLVESMPIQPGYLWVSGHWTWTGYEWSWISGHYAVDASYSY
jgi:hypothetical protein